MTYNFFYPKVKNIRYKIDFIIKNVGSKNTMIIDGDETSLSSETLKMLKLKGCKCSHCGLKVKYFIKQKYAHSKYHHFVACADVNNRQVIFTKDHIVPKSKGGANNMKNYQPMCKDCNFRKGNVDENFLDLDLMKQNSQIEKYSIRASPVQSGVRSGIQMFAKTSKEVKEIIKRETMKNMYISIKWDTHIVSLDKMGKYNRKIFYYNSQISRHKFKENIARVMCLKLIEGIKTTMKYAAGIL